MGLPRLDIPTLCLVSALVIAFSGCLLIVARGRDENAVPLVFWGCALLAGAAGIVMLSLAPFTDLPVRIGANISILTGAALSWTGARVFAGRPIAPLLVGGGAAAWLAAHLLFGRAFGLVPGVLGFVIGALYILATAAELWRGRAEQLPTRNAAIILLVVHGAIYLAQAGGNIAAPALFNSNQVFVLLMLEALLHTTGMAFLFLALMKERAELRSTVQLRELATQDALTGLWNRRHFDQMLEQEFRRARRGSIPLSLLMVDVDQFKTFNDLYGHQAGDQCLRSVALVIGGAVSRPGDLALRYGGEEFAVLLPRTGEAGAAEIAEAIRTEIELLRIEHAGSPRGIVTISVGVASVVPDASIAQADWLVVAADQALYAAKAAGRNAVVCATAVTGAAAAGPYRRVGASL